MFCSKCGNKIDDNAKFCSSCGAVIGESDVKANTSENVSNSNAPTHHTIPKCTCCGNVEEWQVGPLFRTMDFIIGAVLLLVGFVPGLVYMGVVGFIRYNKDNREKICKKCGAKNMFTNLY